MAEIVDLSVFTNDSVTCNNNNNNNSSRSSSSSSSTDLLQQAFQGVVHDDEDDDDEDEDEDEDDYNDNDDDDEYDDDNEDEDDNDVNEHDVDDDGEDDDDNNNNYDERDNEFIAFFKDESGNDQTIRLTREQVTEIGLTLEIDSLIDKTNSFNYQPEQDQQEDIVNDFESMTGSTKVNDEEQKINHKIEFPLTSEWISNDAKTIGDSQIPSIKNNQEVHTTNGIDIFGESVGETTVREYLFKNINVFDKKNKQEESITNQQNAIPIHRASIMLPQWSQYIMKPAQTILKTGNNIKLLSGTHRIQMLNTSVQTNNASENSQLHPKSNFQNGTNGGQIRMALLTKTVPNIQQDVNLQQQFFTSISKAEPARNFRAQISTDKNTLAPPSSPVRHITAKNRNLKYKTIVNHQKISNPQIIVETTSKLKTQNLKKIMANNNGNVIRATNTQLSLSPVSILKPQIKLAFTNGNKQNMIPQTTKLIKKVSSSLQTQRSLIEHKFLKNPLNTSPSVNNDNKVKSIDMNDAVAVINESQMNSMKKNLKTIADRQNPVSKLQAEVNNKNGNTDNTIQLVQQGHTFQSKQKLSKTQLKQIAHVLQQRSHQQKSSISKEKVVYRVVFPEELDLRIKNPSNNLVKGGRAKRGRPKKTSTMRHAGTFMKTGMTDEEPEELKEERKKVVARTRSGRLSRPPRHMVRDYKHLHPVDFMQADFNDSDGGYSDYKTITMINGSKAENLEENKELLTGLEVPKRKVSTHFRCSTCNKIYLGRARMAKHFELHPDHGSLEPLPSTKLSKNEFTDNGDIKKLSPSLVVDSTFKRKGKKRGPWAYVTPEAKSERRQAKLKEALSVCDSGEISKIAAKPVLNAQSLYDLMTMKSDNNVRIFLNELKVFMEKLREQAGIMLSPISDKEKDKMNLIDLKDELLCDALGLVPGIYSINDEVFKKKTEIYDSLNSTVSSEPPTKLQKLRNNEGKENIEVTLPNEFSENSNFSLCDFLPTDKKTDSNCPEVLTALTLMPRNSSPIITEPNKGNVSKLLISSPQIQRQISDIPGFQKVDINVSKSPNTATKTYTKIHSPKEDFTKLSDAINISSSCSQIFTKLENNFEHSKMETMQQQTFIKLEPMQQNFIKLENCTTVGTYIKENTSEFNEFHDNNFHNLTDTTKNFAEGFKKIISNRRVSTNNTEINCDKVNQASSNLIKKICKVESNNMQMPQNSLPMIENNCDAGIFGSTDNLDHIGHLDYSVVMDKHLIMDEKLVEQLHLVDQSNLVDELVSERLKNIMPDNILDNNLMPNSTNLVTELDFEAMSEEFNRNTNS